MIKMISCTAFTAAVLIAASSSASSPGASADGSGRGAVMVMGPGAPLRGVTLILDHAYRHGVQLSPAARLPASSQAQGPDDALKQLFVRYARAVGFGQISPATAGMAWDITRPEFDSGAAQAAYENGSLDAALSVLPPSHPGYSALVSALARYRSIAARGGWPRIPAGRLFSRGMNDGRVPALRRRLIAEGAERVSGSQSLIFDEGLEAAVIGFQRRHGLQPDGIVGSKTLTALNIPVEQRISQIIANMERWRWLPRAFPMRRLEVNIAAANLKVQEGGRQSLRMRVVVGSRRHPTPVLQSTIGKVLINPPWNVPDSIWRREIFPRLRNQPDYLASKHMVIVGRNDDPQGRQIDWRSLRVPPPGTRIQQIPGSFNALGRVKFDVPNRFDVYLHDTPERTLFKRPERALSHGCIRLERPEKLLAYLFPDAALRPRIAGIGEDGPRETKSVAVTNPLPVFILYWTAFAGRNGTVHFRNDVYGHDSRMIAALSRPGRGFQETFLATGCGWKPHAT
ncbi:MAG: L,D-transpeptidase family protein [Alphaproteobacteria bacterium]|nr:L,D-transpeptidase family protein [Alphaproteobacteria bacterium]